MEKKKRYEGSWHCKPWCTLNHKYPANEQRCSFDREYYSNYQKLKGLLSRLGKDGFGCELKDNKLIVLAVRDGKVKSKKFRLDKDFYKLPADEQIKKLQKSL
jgi:hypothetical protein